MKIFNGGPGYSVCMLEFELIEFLNNSKLNLHLGTRDKDGFPNVHPVWYSFNKITNKIYINTSKNSKKAINLSICQQVYFCIDNCSIPYKGVRGKGVASIVDDISTNVTIAKGILLRYLSDLTNPTATAIIRSVENGDSMIVEITPHYFSTWDDSKIKW
ncbi:pyridoxamine 5'-phosphate oxidase family protein [Candidatus Nitrosocosmicus hydrocola]|uniref:pyridoxamine 5'-phosphate oxidase family protein n=1 Tax=Candidatus Nitrosocosmicus hydrocola TaxID=1826872 RepID=UPI0011E5A40F|nr:pyridoxamine 5'-phosphate oxidase family protein [Candidatus Nitrosocosmicus hydrocola]